MAVPELTPVTVPEVPTVAIPVLPLTQVPPDVPSERVVGDPAQTVSVPVMEVKVTTVNEMVVWHPVLNV